mgnify:CR=1 FL=1
MHSTANVPQASAPVGLGNFTVRGISGIEAWRTTLASGESTTTYYVKESRGPANGNGTGPMVMYPFRIQLKYPVGGPEVGYVLDQGTHYPVFVDSWFSTSGCDGHASLDSRWAAAQARHPVQVVQSDHGVTIVDSPHWEVLSLL